MARAQPETDIAGRTPMARRFRLRRENEEGHGHGSPTGRLYIQLSSLTLARQPSKIRNRSRTQDTTEHTSALELSDEAGPPQG